MNRQVSVRPTLTYNMTLPDSSIVTNARLSAPQNRVEDVYLLGSNECMDMVEAFKCRLVSEKNGDLALAYTAGHTNEVRHIMTAGCPQDIIGRLNKDSIVIGVFQGEHNDYCPPERNKYHYRFYLVGE